MNSGEFRADVAIKCLLPAQNSSDNGERVRSLLCGREALARPSGMAENIQGGGFNVDNQHTEISTRRNSSGCRAEPDQEDLVRRRCTKNTSCPAVLSPARSGGNDKTFPVRVSYLSPASGDKRVPQHGLRRR